MFHALSCSIPSHTITLELHQTPLASSAWLPFISLTGALAQCKDETINLKRIKRIKKT
jgi:hypothetical protein